MSSFRIEVVDDVPATFAALVLARGPRAIALSGGDTARRCYERLASSAGALAGATVWIGDERWVPVDHRDSNEGMARAALLDGRDLEVRSVRGAGTTPAAAAAAYDEALRAAPPLDLVHLGLGPDGHTASLFPRSPAVQVEDRLVVATGDAAHPWARVTLTFPGISRAALAVVTVEGAAKAPALRRVLAGEDVPAARLDPERTVWLVDADPRP